MLKALSVLDYFSDLLLEIYARAQTTPVAHYQDFVLELVKAHLPFHSGIWGSGTVGPQGVHIHHVHLHNTSMQMLVEYEAVKHLDTAVARLAQSVRATLAVNPSVDFVAPQQQAVRDFLARWKHHQMLITSDLNPNSRFAQWISLYNHDPAQPYDQDAVRFLARLAPHLMQALSINRRHHLQQMAGNPLHGKWSTAILDAQGYLYFCTPCFARLLQLPAQHQGAVGPELLGALHKPDAHPRLAGLVLRSQAEQGLLFVRVRPEEPIDRLSPREFLIAKLLAAGLSQKEVAERLQRSPETIRSHVRSVFGKLSVNNVVMLPALVAARDEDAPARL